METIDSTDRKIIALLKEKPRESNRALARALSLSEPNVALRISRLEQQGVLRVMAVVDMHAIGYEHVAVVGIRVGDRHPDAVAAELVKLPEIWGVNCTFGRYQLVCMLLARDTHQLRLLLDERIGVISGVQDMECCLMLDTRLMRSDMGILSVFDELHLDVLHSTRLDELDLGIVRALQENGRMSFREVGRRLSAPDATIRSRLSKLENSGAVRLYAVTNTDSMMPKRSSAWIAMRPSGGTLDAVAKSLCEISDTGFVAASLGRFSLLALLVLPSRQVMLDLLSEKIAPFTGTHGLEVWEIVRSYKHDIRIAPKLE